MVKGRLTGTAQMPLTSCWNSVHSSRRTAASLPRPNMAVHMTSKVSSFIDGITVTAPRQHHSASRWRRTSPSMPATYLLTASTLRNCAIVALTRRCSSPTTSRIVRRPTIRARDSGVLAVLAVTAALAKMNLLAAGPTRKAVRQPKRDRRDTGPYATT
ncbi:hypothetical protein SETIT_6G004700v2 [Setaria italica]|uniref:Uncharacterized protein n=1 Tax=Setaria italica TaxID=4555 RepID=A0A368RH00_SETIT|nr:hypothetical protein SETIT_6G004700v2 [Setaria italica]